MTYVTYIAVFAAIIVIFVILYKIFRFVISLLLIGLFLVIAYFTNPTEEMHRSAVLQKAERSDTPMRGKKVRRENYYIFSLTRIDHRDGHTVIGAGAFTQVFIFSKP